MCVYLEMSTERSKRCVLKTTMYNTYYTGRVHGSINSTERVGVTEGSIRAPPLARLLHPKVKISLPHTHTQTHTEHTQTHTLNMVQQIWNMQTL